MSAVAQTCVPADIGRMMADGGLLVVAPAAAASAMGHLINHAEFADAGPVWICADVGAVPDCLDRHEWPCEPVTDQVLRVVLRMPERISVYLSMEHPANMLRLAPSRGAGAVVLDGVRAGDDLMAGIRQAVSANCLVVLVAPDAREPSLPAGDGHRVSDPDGQFIARPQILERFGSSGIGAPRPEG